MRAWPAILMLTVASPAAAYTVPDIEPIYGVIVGKDTLTVRVASGGCTQKSDMTAAVGRNPPRPMVLFARRHADGCRGPGPDRAQIVYSLEELGLKSGEPFALGNPFVNEPTP